MSRHYFLAINNLKVTQAQAIANYYTMGLPSVTGVIGAVHAWQRDLKQKFLKDVKFLATSIYIRDIEMNMAHAKYTPAHEAQRASNNVCVAATVDSRYISFNMDLIIAFKTSNSENIDAIISFLEKDEFSEVILSRPFCGGTVESIYKISCKNDFLSALKLVPSSAFVIECAHEEFEYLKNNTNMDSLETLLTMCERRKRINNSDDNNEKQENKAANDNNGEQENKEVSDNNEESKNTKKEIERVDGISCFCVPLAVGFAALEQRPMLREGAKNSKHIFAEPVLSAGKLRVVGSLRKLEKENNIHNIFWKHTAEKGFFVAKAFSPELETLHE